MIDCLPLNCFEQVVKFLPQEDIISLTYASRELYNRTVVYLYRNIHLNEKPEFKSDLELPKIHNWSLLCIPWSSSHKSSAERKLESLLRSFESNTKLCDNVRKILCSWHLAVPTLIRIISLLGRYATKLQYFEGYLDQEIMDALAILAPRLKSLVIAPPRKVPANKAMADYYKRMNSLIDHYDWSRISDLTLYATACVARPNVPNLLKIRSLHLHLRPDTIEEACLEPFYSLFDTTALEDLFITSWYKARDDEINLYEIWHLYEFHKFHNIKKLTLTSLQPDMEYLRGCFENYGRLEKLTVDYLLDATVDTSTIKCLRRAHCSQTLKCLDINTDMLSPPLLTIDESGDKFVPTMNCQCSDCRDTFSQIIRRKYFPSSEKLSINGFSDVNARHFTLQMFRLFPILPHPLIMGESPAIAYVTYSLQDHADKVNELLAYGKSHSRRITADDIRRLYYAHLHSLKKTFDYYLKSFPNLQYFTLNDIPTQITQVDEQQRCNIPVFYSQGYRSNQTYELVSDESLFD